MRLRLAIVVCALAAAAAPAAARATAGQVTERTFDSAAGPLAYDVYLPPGYATSGLDYPVVYYLHGLPAGATSFRRFGYVAQALEQSGIAAIVVAPQGATATDTDPEYLDWGAGRDWDTALAVQLPEIVDASFRTIPNRDGRALVGVSAGGYGATILGLHHLARFSVIESWSGYFHPTNPAGTAPLPTPPWDDAHTFVASLRRAFAYHPTYLAFYVGASDTLFRPENVELARELSRANVPFVFRMYPGGHTQTLWTAEAPAWLQAAAARLTPPETAP